MFSSSSSSLLFLSLFKKKCTHCLYRVFVFAKCISIPVVFLPVSQPAIGIEICYEVTNLCSACFPAFLYSAIHLFLHHQITSLRHFTHQEDSCQKYTSAQFSLQQCKQRVSVMNDDLSPRRNQPLQSMSSLFVVMVMVQMEWVAKF